ncbi:MAG: hypothetical protein NTZ03_12895 [Actinobacteria bacterium]|nr:hypothetical protein [Actinomycetota bacterium]
MGSVISNTWKHSADGSSSYMALGRETSVEGIDVERARFSSGARLPLSVEDAHIVSPTRGALTTEVRGTRVRIGVGAHLFVPVGAGVELQIEPSSEVVRAASPRARGERVKVIDEEFVRASAVDETQLRWVLTPQYLSRRIFLHHDLALLGLSGHPLGWFRTTMFDTVGLPANQDGVSVLKMAYHSRTEANVCYDVSGTAAVRFALRPHVETDQKWSAWLAIDSDSTYLLDEPDPPPRNMHEVRIEGGHTSVFCCFDPALAGPEVHTPGHYSDYLNTVQPSGLPEFDEMVEELSWAKAGGTLHQLVGSRYHRMFREGAQIQRATELAVLEQVSRSDPVRAEVIRGWVDESAGNSFAGCQ